MKDGTVRSFDPFPFWRYAESKEAILEMQSKIEHIKDWGWCAIDEYAALYEVARGYHDGADANGYILEYGTNRGASISAMALGLRDSAEENYRPAFTIDPFYRQWWGDEAHRDSRETFLALDLLYDYVCPMISQSQTLLKFWRHPIRVLFIDAGHSYTGTKSEIFDSLPFMIDKGWIICHDYGGEYGEQVVQAVNEFLDSPSGVGAEIFTVEPRTIFMKIRKNER